jgi:hypothetical protein
MRQNLLFFTIIFTHFFVFSQTKSITVNYNSIVGQGKKMTGVNTGPSSIISGTTENCLQTIGTELVRTHDYHGPCDYYGYTSFFNYFNQTFDYNFKSHLTSGYNWGTTDTKISEIVNANLQPFFRVGISFPGGSGPSPASPMPKDQDGVNFNTFAGIAKRTAMHYTDGWDNGFNYTIPYWEVWNEPNNAASWATNSSSEYFKIYHQTVDSLKSFNPLLKVGGPAAAKNAFFNGGIHFTINQEYVSNFLNYCQTNTVPLDFYSFHMYDKKNPYNIRILTDTLAYYLNQYGFTNTELIISETNINGYSGYENSAKGCSHLTSQLISTVGSRLSKFIWYRGVDLNPLCNADNGTTPSLTLNGYAYKFFNELNDSTPILINSIGNEFNSDNITDSLNNVMILAGKNSSDDLVKVLISNHESVYSAFDVLVQNLGWSASDLITITTEKVTSSGYSTTSTSSVGGLDMSLNIPSVSDASVFLVTLKKQSTTSLGNLVNGRDFVVYPNPTSSEVFFKTELKDFEIILTNTQGQMIFSGKNITEIDVKDISSGFYFVTLKSKDIESEIFKLMIVK